MGTKNSRWEPESSLGGLILSAASRTKLLHEKSIKEKNIPAIHMGRMSVLSMLEEKPHTQADLCKKLGIKPPSMMEMLGKLEKEDLIFREPDPHDGRKYNWKLTSQGKKSFAKAKKLTKTLGNDIDSFFQKINIKDRQVETAKKVLQALIEFSELKLSGSKI